MYRYQLVILILSMVFGCKSESIPKIDVGNITNELVVDRFDKKFYATEGDELAVLKAEYPYLFPVQNHDSIWLQRMTSEEELNLAEKVEEMFGDFEEEKNQLELLFKHVKYYHVEFEFPKVISLITNLDYESKVMYADTLLFVSLDLYLGSDSEIYDEFPKYLSRNFNKSQLVVDVATEVSNRFVPVNHHRPFINTMIEAGKKMYLIDLYLPHVSDADKMGYTSEDTSWLENNEGEIWRYFIENELLYSTERDLYARFIDNAPFSKFYIDIDKESPGRVGVWLGWQIVRSYMKNNSVDLQQMLEMNADDLFNKSSYKPRR
jgi:gliding motility-associated lipoprotein GldB